MNLNWLPWKYSGPGFHLLHSYLATHTIWLGIYWLFLSSFFWFIFSLAVWKMRKNNQKLLDPANGLVLSIVLLVLAAAYLFVLGFSYIFTSPAPDLISRTFLPVQHRSLIGYLLISAFYYSTMEISQVAVYHPYRFRCRDIYLLPA